MEMSGMGDGTTRCGLGRGGVMWCGGMPMSANIFSELNMWLALDITGNASQIILIDN